MRCFAPLFQDVPAMECDRHPNQYKVECGHPTLNHARLIHGRQCLRERIYNWNKPTAIKTKGASWRRMLTSQPPAYTVAHFATNYEAPAHCNVAHIPEGLRMGSLLDTIYCIAWQRHHSASISWNVVHNDGQQSLPGRVTDSLKQMPASLKKPDVIIGEWWSHQDTQDRCQTRIRNPSPSHCHCPDRFGRRRTVASHPSEGYASTRWMLHSDDLAPDALFPLLRRKPWHISGNEITVAGRATED